MVDLPPAADAALRYDAWTSGSRVAARGVGTTIGGRGAVSEVHVMPPADPALPAAEVLALGHLITPTTHGIASRVLARTAGGNLTLFAFDAGQSLTEHSSPFDALVLVLEGELDLTVGGKTVRATPGSIVRMPAGVPHAVEAPAAARMLLLMLR